MTLDQCGSDITNQDVYRSYLLLAHCDQKSKWIGEIFKDGMRIAYCESVDETSARQHLRTIVDATIKGKSDDRSSFPPSADEISRAIPQAVSASQRTVLDYLVFQVNAGKQRMSISELLCVSKCRSITSLYLMLAEIARAIYDEIGYEPRIVIGERDPFLQMVLDEENHSSCHEEESTLGLSNTFFNALSQTQW